MSPISSPEPVPAEIDLDRMIEDLSALVAIPSVIDPSSGTTVDDVDRAGDLTARLLREAGLTDVRTIEMEPGAPRLIYAEHRVPDAAPGTPTVLMYAHFDVVRAQGWAEAFQPTLRDTPDGRRLFGRGAADDKSAIAAHVAAVRAFDGRPPVHLRIVCEGQEEVGGPALERFLTANPDLFRADVLVVADSGNPAVGCPTLTSTLRGSLRVDVSVRTLTDPVHSGMFGGPAPDAFFVLNRLLAALHDDRGNVAVPGLRRDHWNGAEPDELVFRAGARLIEGVRLVGDDTLGSRIFTAPAITVLGLDGLPSVAGATNVLTPWVTARIGIRIPPEQDPDQAFELLAAYLRQVNDDRFGAKLSVTVGNDPSRGWRANQDHPGYAAARRAMAAAYGGKTTEDTGVGASIPLVSQLQAINPHSAILVWGTEEPRAMIHSGSESVHLEELRNLATAESLLLAELGTGKQS